MEILEAQYRSGKPRPKCPQWVISGHRPAIPGCPLYPESRPGDWGDPVTEQMAVLAPSDVIGIHLNMPSAVPAEIAKASACRADPSIRHTRRIVSLTLTPSYPG